jgi:regulator of replication initiation timing
LIDDQKRIINRLETQVHRLEADLDVSRHETQNVRMENTELRGQLHGLQNHVSGPSSHDPAPSHAHGYRVQQEQLPPLRNIPSDGMNGVQYSHEQRSAAPRGSYMI